MNEDDLARLMKRSVPAVPDDGFSTAVAERVAAGRRRRERRRDLLLGVILCGWMAGLVWLAGLLEGTAAPIELSVEVIPSLTSDFMLSLPDSSPWLALALALLLLVAMPLLEDA